MLKQAEFVRIGSIPTETGTVVFTKSVKTDEVWIEVEGPSGHENPLSIMLKLTPEAVKELQEEFDQETFSG